ncbi:unnamed protein product, partial [Mesorhabditis spiculigera]
MENLIRERDIAGLEQHFAGAKDEFRPEFLQNHVDCLLQGLVLQAVDGTEDPIASVESILSFAFDLLGKGLCTPSAPTHCIADALELCEVTVCERMFSILEERQEDFKKLDFQHIPILRICNDMLKRLSRSTNTAFCGRILSFLSRYFKLTEKSGLNLNGQFNTFNETLFDQLEAEEASTSNANAEEGEDTEERIADALGKSSVDPAFYRNFWSLHAFFADPNKCYTAAEWKKFQSGLREVIVFLAAHKLDKESRNKRKRKATASKPTAYFAKYLTNVKLFSLQLADSQFRRSFLIQCLILMQYLRADVKSRTKTSIMTEEQKAFTIEMEEKCYKLLRDTHPNGQHFSDSVKKVLQREETWNQWKNKGCPDFTSNKKEDKLIRYAKRPATAYDANDLGSADLNVVWKGAQDSVLESCQAESRKFTPEVVNFLQDPLDEADPDQQVEEKYRSIYEPGFQWRCARLLAARSKQYLSTTTVAGADKKRDDSRSIPKFLDNAILRAAYEIPVLRERLTNDELRRRQALLAFQAKATASQSNGTNSTQSDTSIGDSQIEQLGDELADKWELLASALGLDEAQKDRLLAAHQEPSVCCKILLAQWTEARDGMATSHDLVAFLKDHQLYDERFISFLPAPVEEEEMDVTTSMS